MKELNLKEKAIGAGITFPIQVKDGGVYPVVGSDKLITDNLTSLMVHPVGFRLRFEEYGNYFDSFIEEPNTQALNYIIKNHLLNIVNTYEPRINPTGLQSKTAQAQIALRLSYNISNTPLKSYIDVFLDKTS